MIAKLKDVCEFIVDCPHTTAQDEGQGYPLIRTPNIGKGRFDLDGVHRVSEDIYKKRNLRATPQDNDLIFAREAPAGNAAIIKNGNKFCLGQRTVLIRPNPQLVCPDFLTYFLLAPQQQYGLLGTANGATVAHVNLPTIRELEIDIPSLEEQCHIANILSAYDDLIENNQKQIKLLEEAAQRLYKEWFVDLHFPSWENTTIVDGVPEGWSLCTLEDVIEFDPKIKLDKDRLEESVPMSALSTTSMILNRAEFTETYSNSGSKFQNGDTLLARITPCLENGKTAFVSGIESEEGAVGSTEYIVMRSKKINPYMVYLIARSDEFRNYAINSMSGSDGRQRVKADKLKGLDYLCPASYLIDRFGEVAQPIFSKIFVLNKQCAMAQEARDRLLPKLMSGELEV